MLLLNKTVDKSLLKEGFTIPLSYQKDMLSEIGLNLSRGESIPIKILINGAEYEATLKNGKFSVERYPTHGDLLQIRYSPKSPLTLALRSIFCYTSGRIAELEKAGLSTRVDAWENSEREYVVIYSTPLTHTLLFECITNAEFREETEELRCFDEQVTEQILEAEDPNAMVELRTKVCKVRRLNRSIVNDLKRAYGYRCQICGQWIGEKYGSQVVHAHHIDYFTRSMNNDAANILIVCPNHHSIIHDKNPSFDREKKLYRYPNGYSEGLLLNRHI